MCFFGGRGDCGERVAACSASPGTLAKWWHAEGSQTGTHSGSHIYNLHILASNLQADIISAALAGGLQLKGGGARSQLVEPARTRSSEKYAAK